MINLIQNTIGALSRRLGIVKKNLQMWLGFTKADVLGAELIENGDFSDGLNGWSILGAVSLVGDTVVVDGAISGFNSIYQAVAAQGVTYTVTIDVSSISADITSAILQNNDGGVYYTITSVGVHTFNFKHSSSSYNLLIVAKTGAIVGIDSFSVKEVAQFIPDKSTNTNNAKLFTGKALSFNGNDAVSDFGNPNINLKSICFWVNLSTTSEQIFNLTSTHNITASSGVITLGGTWSNSNIYVNGLDTTAIGTTPTRVVITTDTNILVNDLEFAKIGSDYGALSLADVQIYDAELSLADALIDYNNPNDLVFNKGGSIALSNLKGYYALSEGSGSIAYDSATPIGSDVINLDFQSDWAAISGAVVDSQYTFSTVGTGGQIRIDSILTQGSIYQVNISGTTTAALLRFRSYSGNATYLTHSGGGSFSDSFIITSEDLGVRFRANNSSVTTLTTLTLKEISAGTITGATYVLKQPTIPQLGMMDWAKSTPDGTNEVTLIEAPNDLGKDVLGNALRLRDGGFNLDGSGYAEVATLDLTSTDEITISVWLKTVSNDVSMVLEHSINSNNNNSFYLVINDNSKDFKIADHNSGNNIKEYDGGMSGWKQFTFTVDRSLGVDEITGYVNAVDSFSSTGNNADNNGVFGTYPLYIGSRAGTSLFLDAIIDEVLIYDRALSAKEITNNFNATKSKHQN